MEDMARRYADRAVRSVFLYTREAHPGEEYRHHTSMEQKRDNARAFRKHNDIERVILLDDVAGTCHQTYGTLPNMTWIIGRGGVIYYKAAWTDVTDVEEALVHTLDALDRRVSEPLAPFYSERLSWRVRDMEAFRKQLAIAGPQAVSDFFGPKGDG